MTSRGPLQQCPLVVKQRPTATVPPGGQAEAHCNSALWWSSRGPLQQCPLVVKQRPTATVPPGGQAEAHCNSALWWSSRGPLQQCPLVVKQRLDDPRRFGFDRGLYSDEDS
ncbi:unnamed protein product [Arctogadus glacialis]